MRFRVQYKAVDGTWRNFRAASTSSGWQPVGSARYKARQSGWTFPFEPEAAQRFEVRGVVNFQWRADGAVVRRAREVTETGHRSTAGADPEGYSAATCSMA